jgi:hypothetical protein
MTYGGRCVGADPDTPPKPASLRLNPQIPWLRVFVEGVVIVGSI